MGEINSDDGTGATRAFSARDAATLANWTDAARERGPVLFVGAGWSMNADVRPRGAGVDVEPARPMVWNELAAALRRELSEDSASEVTDPLWLAELHRQRFGVDATMRILRQAVPDARLLPGAMHRALVPVRWRAILTTNYDTLLERTYEEQNRRVAVCVDDVDLVRSADRHAVELIHLHGVISREDTVVLALEDYRQYPRTHPGMLAKVRQLFLQHPVLFVGFGLSDPNFLQWTGWLQDVVGPSKNPWVSLTIDPPPSVAYGRFWAARLDIVSVQSKIAFQRAVPAALECIAEALDNGERSEAVAMLRIRATSSPADAVREVRDLLATGTKLGAEGREWDDFRSRLFDAAASRVLELAKIPWRESGSAPVATGTAALTIHIDGRPASAQPLDLELNQALQLAFGDSWSAWLALLGEHYAGDSWLFSRVGVGRPGDLFNRSRVEIRGLGHGTPEQLEPALDALRTCKEILAPSNPQSAQELRIAGYLAMQAGDWTRAEERYRDARARSAAEGEPVRTEYLTLLSQCAALRALSMSLEVDGAQTAERELLRLRDEVKEMRSQLAALPRDGRLDGLIANERAAEHDVAVETLRHLARTDTDQTHRFGDIYGAAGRWHESVERLFVAPSIVAPAAEALGTLQWHFGDHAAAVRTLSRYGSARLRILTQSFAARPDMTERISTILTELGRSGRWAGENVARADGLLPLLGYCTKEQLESAGDLVRLGRQSIRLDRWTAEGDRLISPLTSRQKLERVEISRWRWLDGPQVLDAFETWQNETATASSRDVVSIGIFDALTSLRWKAWIDSGDREGSRVLEALKAFVFSRLNAVAGAESPSVRDFASQREADEILGLIVDLKERGIDLGADVHAKLESLLAVVEAERRALATVDVARLVGDSDRVDTLVAEAVSKLRDDDRISVASALEVLVAARACPDASTVASVLARMVSRLRDALTEANSVLILALADRVGRVLATLLPISEGHAELVAVARTLIATLPDAAEYLAQLPPALLGDAADVVDQEIVSLLCGSGRLGTRREREFGGVRGVVRRVVTQGSASVPDAWLFSVASLVRAADRDVARYATWALGTWFEQLALRERTPIHAAVEAVLRAAAFDARIEVAGNALRALVLAERAAPCPENKRVLEKFVSDQRGCAGRPQGQGIL
ncbi:MAG: SIR2 family protein [Polyangiaceae bacterium]